MTLYRFRWVGRRLKQRLLFARSGSAASVEASIQIQASPSAAAAQHQQPTTNCDELDQLRLTTRAIEDGMANSPSEVREQIYRTAIGPQFRFPRPVAFLLSAVFEPRDDDGEYGEELGRAITSIKTALRSELRQIQEEVETLREAPGKIEAACLKYLPALVDVARRHDAYDVVERLRHAHRVSRGEAPVPSDRDPVVLTELPEPRTIVEGRPPVGLWR